MTAVVPAAAEGPARNRIHDAGRSGRSRAVKSAAMLLAAMMLPSMAFAHRQSPARLAERAATAPASRTPQGPLLIVVSIGSQRLWVYDRAGLLETSTVSTGVGGFPTPTGIFSVIDKEEEHYSNIYGGASMPFMQRLTMSGIALHSGMVTGRPASHGCIRLPHPFAIRLYRLTKLGVRVIVADGEPVPADFSHPRLFVPTPLVIPDLGVDLALRSVATDATRTYTIAGDQPVQPLEPADTVAAELARALDRGAVRARVGQATAEREAALQALAVSVFVSRAEGRVFVRQGFAPIFDAPALIRHPEQPLGTHIYTALAYEDNGARMRWSAISMPPPQEIKTASIPHTRDRRTSRPERSSEPAPTAQVTSSAADALDRIELPPEITERISQLLAPGTSLIVSDHGLNREVRAKGTDFVVLTK